MCQTGDKALVLVNTAAAYRRRNGSQSSNLSSLPFADVFQAGGLSTATQLAVAQALALVVSLTQSVHALARRRFCKAKWPVLHEYQTKDETKSANL